MTDRELEERLRAWYGAEVGEHETGADRSPGQPRRDPGLGTGTAAADASPSWHHAACGGRALDRGRRAGRWHRAVAARRDDATHPIRRRPARDRRPDTVGHRRHPPRHPRRTRGRVASSPSCGLSRSRPPAATRDLVPRVAGMDRRRGWDRRSRAVPRGRRSPGPGRLVAGRVQPAVLRRRHALPDRSERQLAATGRYRLCGSFAGDAAVVPGGHAARLFTRRQAHRLRPGVER